MNSLSKNLFICCILSKFKINANCFDNVCGTITAVGAATKILTAKFVSTCSFKTAKVSEMRQNEVNHMAIWYIPDGKSSAWIKHDGQ